MKDLIKAVKDYAEAHYEDGGWDVIVECWTDSEIEEALVNHDCKTKEEALKVFGDCASAWAERQADARNSAF